MITAWVFLSTRKDKTKVWDIRETEKSLQEIPLILQLPGTVQCCPVYSSLFDTHDAVNEIENTKYETDATVAVAVVIEIERKYADAGHIDMLQTCR